MLSDPFLFAFCLLNTGAILFLLIYFIMTLSDLECDYLNAQQCCSRLNPWVIPKFCAHGCVTFFLLVTGHWWLFLGNVPLFIGLGKELAWSKSKGSLGVYDPTEIHNRGQLKIFMQNALIHIGLYLIFFFMYLYCEIMACLKGNPLERSDEIIS